MKLALCIAALCSSIGAHAARLPQLYAYALGTADAPLKCFDPTASPVSSAINESGQVTGYGFITGPKGVGVTPLARIEGADMLFGLAINDAGAVSGTALLLNGSGSRPFVTGANGSTPILLHTPEPTQFASASAINGSGQTVGQVQQRFGGDEPYLRSEGFIAHAEQGDITLIPTLGGADNGAYGTNNRGQVVGWSSTPAGGMHAFVADTAGGGVVDLSPQTDLDETGVGINDSGLAVISVSSSGTRTVGAYTISTATLKKTALPVPHGTSLLVAGISPNGFTYGRITKAQLHTDNAAYVADKKGRGYKISELVSNMPAGVSLTAVVGMNSSNTIAAAGSDGRCYIVCQTRNCGR